MNIDEAICSKCGSVHPRNELELSFRRPDAVFSLPDAQRNADVYESDDLCVINLERFFVRAVLPLPVREWHSPYRIGLWVEVDGAAFSRIRDLWDDPLQDKEPPFPVTLANEIPSLPGSAGLSATLQLVSPKERPDVILPASDHALHREQCLGITAHRASEYSSFIK